MKQRKEVIDLLAGIKPKVQERVSSTIMAVLSLAEAYRSYGSDFSFDVSETLNKEVMKMMQALSDGCLDEAEEMARKILSWLDEGYEMEEDPFEEQNAKGRGILWAFDMHSSNLLKIIEAWLVIGFTNGLTQGEIYQKIIGYMGAPEASRMWRDAIRVGIIDPNEVKFGKGYQRRIADAITILIQSIIWQFYLDVSIEDAITEGALYYVIHRGSSFDCAYCDSRCERLIPADEPYEASHPRCMCWLEFIFTEEDADKYR